MLDCNNQQGVVRSTVHHGLELQDVIESQNLQLLLHIPQRERKHRLLLWAIHRDYHINHTAEILFAVTDLGFDVLEQQVSTSNLQQHVLSPDTAHPIQQLQTLHAVSHIPHLLPIQLTREQMLWWRKVKHNMNHDII